MAEYMKKGDLTSPRWETGIFDLPVPAYDEIQFQTLAAKVPAANAPTFETFTANTNAYSFTVNDYIDVAHTELPHWWNNTAGDCHIHFFNKTANSTGSNRYVKFTVYFAYANINGTLTETPMTAEYTIPTGTAALTHLYLDLGDIDLSTYKLGSQVNCRIKRIAATGGTEFADNVFVAQVGIHLQRVRFGSKSEAAHLT